MPELPEVETTVRYLRQNILQKVIQEMTWKDTAKNILATDPEEIRNKLLGNYLINISRLGKFMVFEFADNSQAVGHLRMSGRYLYSKKLSDHVHNHFSWHFADGTYLHYIDQRRFGTFELINADSHPGIQKLGPDAWLADIDPGYLAGKLNRRNIPIMTALLDQSLISGLGNIYANEVLHRSGIHPKTPASRLTTDQIALLISNIKPILEMAIKFKGTTLIDKLYQEPGGKTGSFAKMLQVYGKTGQPCASCGAKIVRESLKGRSVYYCPQCQLLAQ